MRKRFVTSLALLLALSGSVAMAEELRWVTSEGTTLKQEATMSSPDVSPLAVGTELSVIESGGRWIKVRTADGKEGFVYAGRISDTQPAAEVTGGEGGLFGTPMQQSQIKSAKADSARSIRGLSPETAQYAKQRGTPEVYKKALDKILARKVSDKELKAFLREGKIGEYAQ
ncbi:MAG TPA: SH3 domain-containing protein [Candidatus Methylomirabilis sp.]|nr:SH3 domain-containing protein [Candidatus Methylomirabilis sp.]